MNPDVALDVHELSSPALVTAVMRVMDAAFDPAFGEAWTASQLRSMLDLPGTHLVTARLDGSVAGFGLIRSIAGEAELLLLAVTPTARGRGIGRALLDRCQRIARHTGARVMFLEVRDGNDATALYKSASFHQYSQRHDYYLGRDGQRRSALSFRCDLAQET